MTRPSSKRHEGSTRPATYWEGPAAEIGRETCNLLRERRKAALGLAPPGGGLPRRVLEAAPTASSPYLFGGETLPNLYANEIEILRLQLDESAHYEVISLRARPRRGGGIRYRMVSSYDRSFRLPFQESDRPLSFDELTDLLERTRPRIRSHLGGPLLGKLFNERLTDESLSTALDYVTADSPFYPGIRSWVREWAKCWIADLDWLDEEDVAAALAEEDPIERGAAAGAGGDSRPPGDRPSSSEEPTLLPDRWPHTDLDISVSLQLDERLGNCVYDGFWIDFAAASLEHAVEMLKAHADQTLVYCAHLPLEEFAFDATLTHEASWPLSRCGSLDRVRPRDLAHPHFEHTGMPAALTIRNRYLGGDRFSPELTICGSSPEDVHAVWRQTARRIRRLWKEAGLGSKG